MPAAADLMAARRQPTGRVQLLSALMRGPQLLTWTTLAGNDTLFSIGVSLANSGPGSCKNDRSGPVVPLVLVLYIHDRSDARRRQALRDNTGAVPHGGIRRLLSASWSF